ncbi:hypothetical protein J7L06_01950 [Candidatus Bathyarchaeota archaeon]|nr:hypothetical protein [Candidatus Bathyarchaeota archaeon]
MRRLLGLTAEDVVMKLREGDTIIWLNRINDKLIVKPFGLLEGDEEIIVNKLEKYS